MITDERLEMLCNLDTYVVDCFDAKEMARELLTRRRAERDGGSGDITTSDELAQALLDAGWRSSGDAQWEHIRAVWGRINRPTPASDKAASDLADLEERVAALESWRKEQEAWR